MKAVFLFPTLLIGWLAFKLLPAPLAVLVITAWLGFCYALYYDLINLG